MNKAHFGFLVSLAEELRPLMEGSNSANTFVLAPIRQGTQFGEVEFITAALHCEEPEYLTKLVKKDLALEEAADKIVHEHSGFYTIVFVDPFHCSELAKYLLEEKLQDSYVMESIEVGGREIKVLKFTKKR